MEFNKLKLVGFQYRFEDVYCNLKFVYGSPKHDGLDFLFLPSLFIAMLATHSKIENNTILQDTDSELIDYNYNFVDTPWDDRSQRSKICIVGLLCAIFVATMSLITHNLIIFYTGYKNSPLHSSNEINCNVIKVDKYLYAARIHSVTTQELICLGAMITTTTVLASAVCLESGPIRLYVGSLANPHCKKGFAVEGVELIPHEGVVTKNLVLLTTRESLLDCGNVVRLGLKINMTVPAFVIGRPFRAGRSLSLQPATLAPVDNCTLNMGSSIVNLNKDYLICVKYLTKCLVRAGDLLVQRDRLIGIASTSTHRGENNNMACFANLSLVHEELKELEGDDVFDIL